MLRRQVFYSVLPVVALTEQQRLVRYSSITETLKPSSGETAGQVSMMSGISMNGEEEDERRFPGFRSALVPRVRGNSYLSTMHRWGYNSLSLFHKTNEDPGPWWNAGSSTLISNWSQIGDVANAGMWSGVGRYCYGQGRHNIRPYSARSAAWGRKEKKSGALSIDYDDQLEATPTQKFLFPHTKEHQQHQRIKNPPLPGFVDIDGLHGKRVLREIQYHLGNGIRFYLIDGVFGSHGASATPYRIITDNPTSAYFASIAAIRKSEYTSREEAVLIKRVAKNPLDEWGWRRPGVLVYHAPAFEFEAPRIVEEFGGPRPQDLSLKHPKFIALEPYSIPMKAVVAAEPKCETLLDTTAFLCARWGFYADGKKLLTLSGDAVVSADGNAVTVVVGAIGALADALKGSKYLFGAHHVRLNGDYLSRAWDVTSIPQANAGAAQPQDLVETSLKRIQRPLSLRLGNSKALSHRLFKRRSVGDSGYKYPHNYVDDVHTRADQAGHLFGGAAKNTLTSQIIRPNAIGLGSVKLLVVSSDKITDDPATAVVNHFAKSGFLYAEQDKLTAALKDAFAKLKSVRIVDEKAAAAELEQLAKSGSS